jgi:hypothetical protein
VKRRDLVAELEKAGCQLLRHGSCHDIAMSLEWLADLLIMDESSGRAMARNLNIRITGTLGVLLKAKRYGQIPSLKSEMDCLVQDAGFFVSDRVRNTFLAEAGKSP